MTKTVPDGAGRLIDFLNTREHARHGDTLEAGAAELPRLRALRDALTVLADHEHEPGAHQRAWAAIDALAATVPVTLRFPGAGRSEIQAEDRVGALLADLRGAVEAGHWSRVRLCAFAPCGVAFYDATRSRTQRWHDYATCGNRENVRAFRRRAGTSR
jgi:predicted RNA-binding Zn ribbon-like protein